MCTGNPCLDMFFTVVKDVHFTIDQYLEKSWAYDPLTTLKLICNFRGIKGTGKGDKENFYKAALWLYENHNKNLLFNFSAMASFGYLKDMLEILFRLLEGFNARIRIQSDWTLKKKRRSSPFNKTNDNYVYGYYNNHDNHTRVEVEKKMKLRAMVLKEKRVEANEAKMRVEREMASKLREEARITRSKKFWKLYHRDMYFQSLYEKVSSVFADMLKADMARFNSGQTSKISLAAKWCPSLDSFFDKHTLICGSIAKKVFPRESYPEYEGLEDAHYEYRVRDRLRKQVLVPLREVLQLPEVYMSAQKWDSVAYNRVASVAMTNYTDIFMAHDKERFTKYLQDAKAGKVKNIPAGALLPHKIIQSCLRGYSEGQENVAELQWKRMVDDMSQKGKLSNCIAVCDVSMQGTPKDVSVALGLLVSELSEGPWKGQVITFSQNPQLHLIEGDSLLDKCKFIESLKCGTDTNFRRVFDQILKVAQVAKLSKEQMVKRVFVFSHMEFRQASLNNWDTDYNAIKYKYKKMGYEIPQIVFWNLTYSVGTPVPAKQSGVALLSGFSKSLLTLFLDADGEINPKRVMEDAISGKDYQKLVLYDDD